MPVKLDPLKERVLKIDADDTSPFPIETGRELFEFISLTNLNRSPIANLKAQILAGLIVTGDPKIKVVETTEHLLVDGSIVIYYNDFLSDLTFVREDYVTQALRDDTTGRVLRDMRRVYTLSADGWTIVDEKKSKGVWSTFKKITSEPLPADTIHVFPNGEGILYWPQNVFHRIEEIEQTIREQTGKSALAMYIIGFMGDMDQLNAQLALNPSVISIPGTPGSTKMERIHSTEAVSHLMSELGWLLERWRDSTFDLVIGDENAESGVSRRYRLKKLLEFIKVTRAQLNEIYKPFGVTLVFDKIETLTVSERTQEYALAKTMHDDGVISKKELKDKGKRLL